MQTQPILVVGSVAFDDVETPFGKRENALGGSAIYFALAASKFTQVRIVGVAGQDYPPEAIKLFNQHKIDTTGLEIAAGKTFRWGGKYHQDINQRDTLYTYLNVFADFKPHIPPQFRSTPLLFLGNIQPELQLEVLQQLDQPKFVALDTMNLWIKTARPALDEVISKVDLLIINDSELKEITNEFNLLKGLYQLHQRGLQYVIVKRGEHGAYFSWRQGLFYAPAYPVEQAVDPTGAGDSFAGGLMGYLATQPKINAKFLRWATLYACVLGSFCVENFSIDGLLNLDLGRIEQRFQYLRRLVKI